MSAKKFNLPAPLKGYVEIAAFGQQPPGSSPAMRNVMLLDPNSERFRIAQRPGTGPYDLFDFATGLPIGTTSGGTRTLSSVELPASGVTTSDAGAIIISIPNRGCYTVSATGPGVTVSSSGNGCGPTTITIGGQPNNSGETQSGTITITPTGGGGTLPDPTTTIPWTQPPTDPDDPGDPIPDPETPYLKVVTCADGTFVGWIHQNVLAFFNALPIVYLNDECCTVTGQRTTEALATPKVVSSEAYLTCTDCVNHHTWVQLNECVDGVDGSAVDAYILKSEYVADGGGTLYFKASDGGCYFTSGGGEVTVPPGTVLSVIASKESCDDCNTKTWYQIYSLTFDCETQTVGPVTFERSECLDPAHVSANQWQIIDISGGQGIYEYYDPVGSCHTGDTPPDPLPANAPAAPDPSFFDPASECAACTLCGLMCLSEGTELDGLSWDLSAICALASCSDFAGVLIASGLDTMIWDGTFLHNEIGDDLAAFGPFAIDLGNGWSGTAHFDCPSNEGGFYAGGLIVLLTNGAGASINLEFRNYNDPPDDGDYTPSLGNLPLYLSSISYSMATPNCPASGTCSGVTDGPITGSVQLINVCCQSDGTCHNGTPQPGENFTPMGNCGT
jgi:hypothetical protein